MDPNLLKGLKKLTKAVHTGGLECSHSRINKYCPKRQNFSYRGMVARTELAVFDNNSKVARPQARTKDGTLRYKIVFPKRTKQWVAKPISTPKSHDWRHDLTCKAVRFRLGELSKQHVENILLPDDILKNIADTEFPPPKVRCDQPSSISLDSMNVFVNVYLGLNHI